MIKSKSVVDSRHKEPKKKRKKTKLVEGHGINDYEGKVSWFELVGSDGESVDELGNQLENKSDQDSVIEKGKKNKTTVSCDIYSMWKIMLRQCFSDKFINPVAHRSKLNVRDNDDNDIPDQVKPFINFNAASANEEKRKPKSAQRKRMTVCDKWLSYKNFREWAVSQNVFSPCPKHEGRMRRKDSTVFSTTFLDRRNKHFSPETCVFVSKLLSRFMNPVSINGLPIGVHVDNRASTKESTIFTASVYDPIEHRILEIDDFKSKYYRDLMFDNFISKSGKAKKRNAKRLGLYSSSVKAHMAWKAQRHQYAIQLADIESKRKNCDERIVKALKTRFSERSEWLLASGR